MDSKERDEREKRGMSERREKIYRGETGNKSKMAGRGEKPDKEDSQKYDPSDRDKRGEGRDINDQVEERKKKEDEDKED